MTDAAQEFTADQIHAGISRALQTGELTVIPGLARMLAEQDPIRALTVLVHELVTRARQTAEDTVTVTREFLQSFHDTDPCWFDHHGGCQAHGYLDLEPGELCPQAELGQLLADPMRARHPMRSDQAEPT